jgi:SET domain-containing protein 6
MKLQTLKPVLNVAVAKSLLQVTQKRLTEYPTTIAQDDEILAHLVGDTHNGPAVISDTSQRRLLMAIKVRRGEKEILGQLLTLLEEYIAENEDTPMSDSHSKRDAQHEINEESSRKKSRKA